MTAGLPEIQSSILGGKKVNIERINRLTKDYQLDREWVEMILEALEVGISVDEIKDFFAEKDRSGLVVK
jgi:DNA-binding transcriptional MerR regulator